MAFGAEKFALAIEDRMYEILRAQPQIFDFGTIQEDLSLKLNSFACPIPVSDYLMCGAVFNNPFAQGIQSEADDIPPSGRAFPLRPGTRVIVARVCGDFVVMDVFGSEPV